MHGFTAILVSGSILFPTLPVDFRIVPQDPASVTPSATALPQPGPIGRERLSAPNNPQADSGQGAAPARPTVRPAAVFPVAQGFGSDVPLRFAVRQIVPAGISAIFADGVEQDASVTWRGGGPWNRVLQNAIQPLGLRLLIRGRTVTINR